MPQLVAHEETADIGIRVAPRIGAIDFTRPQTPAARQAEGNLILVDVVALHRVVLEVLVERAVACVLPPDLLTRFEKRPGDPVSALCPAVLTDTSSNDP